MLGYKKEGLLIVLSGPSGAGKGTLCNALRQHIEINYSISATTRAPRQGEVDGINYFFMTKADFRNKIEQGGFLEWAEVYDNYYGTPLDYIRETTAKGKDVMVEIDPQGAKQVRLKMPNAILVFIMPPSYKELEKRIRGRGTETEEEINKRLGCAVKEINTLSLYDYVVLNNDLEDALYDLKTIINSERCKVMRNRQLPEEFSKEKELL